MCLRLLLTLSVWLSVVPVITADDSSADQQSINAISHPDNLQLSLWAGSEQLANPVAFTFDNQGRMFICETFRQNKGVEDNRGHMDWLDDDLAAQTVEDRLAYYRSKHKEEYDCTDSGIAKLVQTSKSKLYRQEDRDNKNKDWDLIMRLAQLYNVSYPFLAHRMGLEHHDFTDGLEEQIMLKLYREAAPRRRKAYTEMLLATAEELNENPI